MTCISMDARIVEKAGRSIPEIVENLGWPAFRDMESEVARDLAMVDNIIIDSGGGIESADANSVAAALRETREEVGIDAALVQPFGYLDCFETISGYCVTPVVAQIDPAYRATPDPHEVADVFEAPLAFFLDPANLRQRRLDWQGRTRDVFEFAYNDRIIWGATAAMLLSLVRRIEATP